MRTIFPLLCALTVPAFLFVSGCKKGTGTDPTNTGSTTVLTLGTAPPGGTFALVAAAIKGAVEKGVTNANWRVFTESTKGTQQNIRALDKGKMQLGMANSAITYFAVRGAEGWDKEYQVQQVMTLAPNVAQFVTREGSGIDSIAAFKGKRIVVGPAGAGFEYFLKPILKEHGVSYDDFTVLNNNYSGAADMLKNGDADVAFIGGAVPMPAIKAASSTHKLAFVPFAPDAVQRLKANYPFFRPMKIAADKYSFLSEDFQAISCGEMQLITASSVPAETIETFTKALWEQRAEVVKGHPAGKFIRAGNVSRDVGTPLHPGAKAFYESAGLMGE